MLCVQSASLEHCLPHGGQLFMVEVITCTGASFKTMPHHTVNHYYFIVYTSPPLFTLALVSLVFYMLLGEI